MENGKWSTYRREVEAVRSDVWGTTKYKALSFMEGRQFSRNQKRSHPKVLDVHTNTSSSYTVSSQTLLQLGKTGPMGSPYKYRWDSLVNVVDWGLIEGIATLTSLDEMSPIIQNKILSDIVSGKAQLAVDLVELRKTKSMMANAGFALFQAFRDIRAGRPFRQFAQAMRKEGFSGLAGRKWLEFIYGWSPTVSGAFDTAEVLANELQRGLIVRGKVRARQKVARSGIRPDLANASYEAYCNTTAKGYYQYTVRDPKLLRLSQLGFTNPLAIAWELTPWSFVLDWFVDVGGYINRMDFSLGIDNFVWQYGCFQECHAIVTFGSSPVLPGVYYREQPGKIRVDVRRNYRSEPNRRIVNTFRGFKRFTNETVRLTSAVALLNQQRQRLQRLRF